jgi:hypothetical protein
MGFADMLLLLAVITPRDIMIVPRPGGQGVPTRSRAEFHDNNLVSPPAPVPHSGTRAFANSDSQGFAALGKD